MSNINILVVDDDPLNIQTVNECLISANPNYELLNATSAPMALKIASSVKPSLIVTDWQMPDMDGLEFISLLKQDPDTSNIPVIMATGIMTTSEDLHAALSAGATDYVRKPFDKIELIARVRTCLQLGETMQAVRQQEIIKNREKLNELEAELNYRQRELSSNLSLLMYADTMRERMLEEIAELRPFLNSEGKTRIASIIVKYKSELKEQLWPDIENKFNELNTTFYYLLEQHFPEITRNEKMLCGFLKMNLNTSEIARITGKSQNSIHVAFARLRAKLNLPSGKELKTFLNELQGDQQKSN